MQLTVIASTSNAPVLSRTMPGHREILDVGDACGVNPFGTVHQVRGRPWRLTRVYYSHRLDTRLSRLQDLQRLLTMHPTDGVHTFFWYGVVAEATSGRTERVLLETDVQHRTATLAKTSVLDLSLGNRLRLASSLSETLAAIADLPATLGRLDGDTIRLDLAQSRALVTSLESGAFGSPFHQLVLDVGQASGQLAPELYDGDGIHAEYADTRTDAWALAVALHRILFGCHPYHFMPDLRPDTVARELTEHTWPGPGTTAEFDAVYRALPAPVLGLLHRVFQRGWAEPELRPSANEWSNVLGPWSGPPEFTALTVDKRVVVAGEPVTVNWTTQHATHVATAEGQLLAPTGTATFRPPATGPIALWAFGLAESVSAATPTILVLRKAVAPPLRPAIRPEPAVSRPEPAVDRPDLVGTRFADRPAMARPAPISRPPTIGRPPPPPRFPSRPSRLQ
jgi:hypothetical protein